MSDGIDVVGRQIAHRGCHAGHVRALLFVKVEEGFDQVVQLLICGARSAGVSDETLPVARGAVRRGVERLGAGNARCVGRLAVGGGQGSAEK